MLARHCTLRLASQTSARVDPRYLRLRLVKCFRILGSLRVSTALMSKMLALEWVGGQKKACIPFLYLVGKLPPVPSATMPTSLPSMGGSSPLASTSAIFSCAALIYRCKLDESSNGCLPFTKGWNLSSAVAAGSTEGGAKGRITFWSLWDMKWMFDGRPGIAMGRNQWRSRGNSSARHTGNVFFRD